MSGVRISALYGFYPHRLGFCGPQEKEAKKTIFDYLSGKKISEKKIRKILQEFKAAYPYYQLIARSNRVSDPFDEKVVRAYWIGNELLEKVPLKSLKEMIIKKFSGPGLLPLKIAWERAKRIPVGSIAHHSFHVLTIGSITGRINLTGKLLDFCRIGWGRIKERRTQNVEFKIRSKETEKFLVEYEPLVERNKGFRLGKPKIREFSLNKHFVKGVKIGDWVSLHWGQVIEVLNKKDLSNLSKYTKLTVNSING